MFNNRKMKDIKKDTCPVCKKKHRTWAEVESCYNWLMLCASRVPERISDQLVIAMRKYIKGY